MAEWPTVAEVKSSLGVTAASKDAPVSAALGAAIEQVAVDIGYKQIDVDQESAPDGVFTLTATLDPDVDAAEVIPSYSVSQAALILAVMAMKAPDAPFGVAAVFDLGALRVAADHPTYLRMLKGSRYTFGLA